MTKAALAATLAILVMLAAFSMTAGVAVGSAHDPRVAEAREATALLGQLVSLRSVSADAEGARATARWLVERFRAAGLDATVLSSTPSTQGEGGAAGEAGDGNPLVFAERKVASPSLTLLFYMHYDTQPTGPQEDWASTSGDPFAPTLLSGKWDEPATRPLDIAQLDDATLPAARLYARGAADDKATIVMHLRALKRWLAMPGSERIHLKYLLDGEEEMGSPHIAESLKRHAERLKADLLVLCDGAMDALGRPSVYLGARGDLHARLRVRTAGLPAHSGNYALLPNAAWRLAALLSTMKDASGRVTIEGFEDDVVAPTPSEKESLRQASLAEPAIAAHLGVTAFEGEPGVPYFERLLFHPALVINHLASGRPGNQIPVVAEALLEVRLVTRQQPRAVFEKLRRHVMDRLPDAELEYLDGSAPSRMDPTDLILARAITAYTRAAGRPALVYPTLGGTLPLLSDFAAAGHVYVGLPLVNFDNNQHVGNENVRIGVLPDGVDLLVRLLEAFSAP